MYGELQKKAKIAIETFPHVGYIAGTVRLQQVSKPLGSHVWLHWDYVGGLSPQHLHIRRHAIERALTAPLVQQAMCSHI